MNRHNMPQSLSAEFLYRRAGSDFAGGEVIQNYWIASTN